MADGLGQLIGMGVGAVAGAYVGGPVGLAGGAAAGSSIGGMIEGAIKDATSGKRKPAKRRRAADKPYTPPAPPPPAPTPQDKPGRGTRPKRRVLRFWPVDAKKPGDCKCKHPPHSDPHHDHPSSSSSPATAADDLTAQLAALGALDTTALYDQLSLSLDDINNMLEK